MPPPAIAWPLGAAFLAIETLRVWIFLTLRDRWMIQVAVLPGETPVTRGPYRFLRHPNYVVVFAEVGVVSGLVGAGRTLLVAVPTVLLLLVARIRREEAAWQAIAARPLR